MNIKEFEKLYIGDETIMIRDKEYHTPNKNNNGKYMIPYVYNKDKFMEVDSINFQVSKYHHETIIEHVYSVVCRMNDLYKHMDIKNRKIAIAIAMFHDIGKKYTIKVNKVGDICFYNHEKLSADILNDIIFETNNFGFDKKEREIICIIINQHMQLKNIHDDIAKDIYINGLINIYGIDAYDYLSAIDKVDYGMTIEQLNDSFMKEVENGSNIVEKFLNELE